MISISESAQGHFAKLLDGQDDNTNNIRVFVVNPGTPHAECGVSFCPDSAIETDDKMLSFNGFNAYIDTDSAPFLEDAEVDYVKEGLDYQLTLKAPNAKVRAVSDDAPLDDRVNYVLQSEVNPQLAAHGGMVNLVDLTEDGIAVLKFGGGCQGCGMVNYTLKEGVEKNLLEKFPGELTAVKDVTEHEDGENPYYR
ncbi:MAG: Fe-S biogenesis protein NfuA [Gammaproteobacteria bacterium]|nr:Fe-S biogenesis protein NfuA [Gammaproteobacteria bacterium]NNJ72924.1 Fe-S biogenesis protein NfuA [Enterobacterales bacterium]